MLVFGDQDWITTLHYSFQDKENLVRGSPGRKGGDEKGGGNVEERKVKMCRRGRNGGEGKGVCVCWEWMESRWESHMIHITLRSPHS